MHLLNPLVHLAYLGALPALAHLPAALIVILVTVLARTVLHPLMRRPGLLTAMLQLPVFAVIYRLFTSPVIAGQQNLLLDQTMLGAPMAGHVIGAGLPALAVLVGLLALIALVAWLTVLDARAHPAPLPAVEGQPEEVVRVAARLRAVAPYASLGSVVFAVFMPLAAMLYLLTSSTWSLAERRRLRASTLPATA